MLAVISISSIRFRSAITSSWRAFFEPVVWRDDLVAATEEQKKTYQAQLAKWEEAAKPINDQINALLEPYVVKKWKSTVDKFPLDISLL